MTAANELRLRAAMRRMGEEMVTADVENAGHYDYRAQTLLGGHPCTVRCQNVWGRHPLPEPYLQRIHEVTDALLEVIVDVARSDDRNFKIEERIETDYGKRMVAEVDIHIPDDVFLVNDEFVRV